MVFKKWVVVKMRMTMESQDSSKERENGQILFPIGSVAMSSNNCKRQQNIMSRKQIW